MVVRVAEGAGLDLSGRGISSDLRAGGTFFGEGVDGSAAALMAAN